MESLSTSRYIIRSEAPRLKINSTRYIASCLLSFILDLKDQYLFMRKLNQKTMERAAEFETMTDSPARSLNTKSNANSNAALHRPVTT